MRKVGVFIILSLVDHLSQLVILEYFEAPKSKHWNQEGANKTRLTSHSIDLHDFLNLP